MDCSLASLLSDPHATKCHREGTHRIVTPEVTVARVSPLLPIMGITRIANVTGLDTVGIPVVMVTRPNSRSVSVSQGKGATLAAAKASGVMESIEGFHAERIDHPLKYGSYEELRWSHRLVDVDRLPRYAHSHYHPHQPMLWIEGENLLGDGRRWLPFEMVHLNYTLPLPPGTGCFAASSNGLASGNSRLEAVVHALTEVIERDAATLWALRDEAEQDLTRVDPATVDSPGCRQMMALFAAAGVAVAIWDITSNLKVPAFLVRIAPADDAPAHTIRPASGFGCHPCAGIALSRALTEAAQSRLTFISGARDDMPRAEYLRHLAPDNVDSWRHRIINRTAVKSFAAVRSWDMASLADDLRLMLDRLRDAGIEEAVAVDLTRADFNIPVVRIVVPGLEGMAESADYLRGRRAMSLEKSQ